MARIPEETIRKVLEATDIVTLVSSYIPLKKAGTIYKGCCPFHHEKTPSFTVSPSRQSFKCFGCGEGGSAVGFVMKYENLPFADALRKLADKASIHVEEEAYDPKVDRERKRRIRLIELHKGATQWFHEQLMDNPGAEHARNYLKNRGYDDSLAKNWKIGWVPDESRSFFEWVKSAGFTGKELIESGLCFLKNERNPRSGLMGRFRDRLMFPIANDYGEIVAFSGRILEAKENVGKYINSPETSLFRKGNVIFGLDRARRGIAKKESALICEGQIDVIACHEAGIDNAIAPLGTAFTTQQARLIRRYTTRVTLCFDGDSAGMKAADRAFRELAPEGLHVSLVLMPPGEDPDSLIKKEGAEGFSNLVRSAKPFFEARMQRAHKEGKLSDPSTRSEFISEMAQSIALIPNNVYRDAIIADVATLLRTGIPEFRHEVLEAAKEIAFRKKTEARREEEMKKRERQQAQAGEVSYDEGSPDFEPREGEAEPEWGGSSEGEILTPRIIPMDGPLRQLCEMALQFEEAHRILVGRMEDLYEPLQKLRGGFLLKKVLSEELDVSSPAAVQAFIELLPPSEAYTLRQLDMNKVDVENMEEWIHNLVGEVVRLSLIKEKDDIIASINAASQNPEELLELLKRLEMVSKLLL